MRNESREPQPAKMVAPTATATADAKFPRDIDLSLPLLRRHYRTLAQVKQWRNRTAGIEPPFTLRRPGVTRERLRSRRLAGLASIVTAQRLPSTTHRSFDCAAASEADNARVTTKTAHRRFALFVVVAFVSAPVSIVTAVHLAGNGPLSLGLFIFFVLPALVTLALGALMQPGLVRTLGTAACVGILGGGLTLWVFLILLSRSGALS
jgi:hypothetical protein